MKRSSHKRRRVVVDKHVQGALARRIALHWVCFISLSVSLTCVLCAISNFDKLSFFESALTSLKAQTGSLLVLLALLPWFVRDAMELSHRFAGPMVRVRHAMKGLANGEEISPVVFRRGDFWMDVADEINRVREVVLFGKHRAIDPKLSMEAAMAVTPTVTTAQPASDASTLISMPIVTTTQSIAVEQPAAAVTFPALSVPTIPGSLV